MTRNPIPCALAIAVGMIATAAGAKYLQAADVIDAEAVKRLIQVSIGLSLAVWGNYMPKGFTMQRAPHCAVSPMRSAVRLGGWAMTLAGLTHAVMWASAPLPVADAVATTAVVSALTVTMTYGLWTVWRCRTRPRKNASA